MQAMQRIMMVIVAAAGLAFLATGCKSDGSAPASGASSVDQSNSDHPKSDHPNSDHPNSEHPK